MIEKIKKDLLINISKDRYLHTLRVVDTCKKLAINHNMDLEKTTISALLHDSAKFIKKERVVDLAKEFGLLDKSKKPYNTELLHGPLAVKIAISKYDVVDKDILNAIKYHTTGRRNMSLLEKIIFMGDYIEPHRNFEGIQIIRNLAFEDLDKSLLLALDTNIKFLIESKKTISIDSIDARNYLIEENLKKRR
ncbi:MAG: bis(5'-nucleosyl)-tetraphosphatase (symmetrical) YqeK [Tissierella sp.]|uniref:bis(5'-nucleosyl)-tetraphosphatase (symmetrical) YqeK n=1 Tax=Tissierella sp. TaxID=41274 RepID=UPI003F9A5AEC